jgi:integrase
MPRHIRFAGLQGKTLRSYRVAVSRFLRFTRVSHLPLATTKEVDAAAAEYVNALYQEGDSLAQAGHLLSGLKRFLPQLRLRLPTASQFFRNWQRIHQPERAVPVSWDLLQALAGLCLTLERPGVALMLYLGFFCFLRTSEMLALQCFHLLLHETKPQITVIIPYAKTSNGNPQVLVFSDPKVWELAVTVVHRSPRDAFLWPGFPHHFRSFWRLLLATLAFGEDDYVPYGIRRGGASWHFLETASMDATLHRGRWSCVKTARQYVDQGTLAMAKLLWTPSQRRAVRKHSLKGAKILGRLRQEKGLGNGSWCEGWVLFFFPLFFINRTPP